MVSLPISGRALPNVPPPLWEELPSRLLYEDENQRDRSRINVDMLRNHLLREGRLHKEDVLALIRRCKLSFEKERNLLWLPRPSTSSGGSSETHRVVVVGDIHGQFHDLVKILHLGGPMGAPQTTVTNGSNFRRSRSGRSDISNSTDITPRSSLNAVTTYLFLGDYVDRGYFSSEVLILLMALKVNHPDRCFMLRGNHESRHVTSYFTFYTECEKKYDAEVYYAFMELFDALPLAAMVGENVLCVHGGISPKLRYVRDIDLIHRFREVPSAGVMTDLVWADPYLDLDSRYLPQASASSQRQATRATVDPAGEDDVTFYDNVDRGCSCLFTFGALMSFLRENNLLTIVRAHEAQSEGFCLHRHRSDIAFPALITVFSAPNYCDTYDNKGAFVVFSGLVPPKNREETESVRDDDLMSRENTGAKIDALGRTRHSPVDVSPGPFGPGTQSSSGLISPRPRSPRLSPRLMGSAPSMTFRQFYSSPHPYVLPGFMNGFSWSLPFLQDAIGNFLMAVLNGDSDDDDDASLSGVDGKESTAIDVAHPSGGE